MAGGGKTQGPKRKEKLHCGQEARGGDISGSLAGQAVREPDSARGGGTPSLPLTAAGIKVIPGVTLRKNMQQDIAVLQ
jgi:hypothetical protein